MKLRILALTGISVAAASSWMYFGGTDPLRTKQSPVTVVTGVPRQEATNRTVVQEEGSGRIARGISPTVVDARQLYDMVRNERRDDGWARPTEMLVQHILSSVPAVNSVTVTCASTICEASGVAAMGASPDAVRAAWASLRQTLLLPVIHESGLVPAATTFGSGRSIRSFTLYFQRH